MIYLKACSSDFKLTKVCRMRKELADRPKHSRRFKTEYTDGVKACPYLYIIYILYLYIYIHIYIYI